MELTEAEQRELRARHARENHTRPGQNWTMGIKQHESYVAPDKDGLTTEKRNKIDEIKERLNCGYDDEGDIF